MQNISQIILTQSVFRTAKTAEALLSPSLKVNPLFQDTLHRAFTLLRIARPTNTMFPFWGSASGVERRGDVGAWKIQMGRIRIWVPAVYHSSS